MKYLCLFLVLLGFLPAAQAQQLWLSDMNAGPGAPVFTTYAAAKERSEFALDEGYHLNYDDSAKAITFETDKAGDWGLAFKSGDMVAYRESDMYSRPVITASYPDMMKMKYRPFWNLDVKEQFFVYSSHIAVRSVWLKNTGRDTLSLELIPFLRNRAGKFHKISLGKTDSGITFYHMEPVDGWVKSHHSIPYVDTVRDAFAESIPFKDVVTYTHLGSNAVQDTLQEFIGSVTTGNGNNQQNRRPVIAVAMPVSLVIAPGDSLNYRMVRAESRMSEKPGQLFKESKNAFRLDLNSYEQKEMQLYTNIPRVTFDNPDLDALYWNAFNLMQQVMLPAEGQLKHNYYVFSREPQWGWGHGGQVFHESLSMLAYVYMDPDAAMNSQRVFREVQHKDGYINYRTGAYLNETIPYHGQLTSSGPFYSWENWQIYRLTHDRKFLRDMYESGEKLYKYFVANRDSDKDGLCEWGGQAVLESLRDSKVAVWDQVGWPSEFEDLDLNCMLVQEAKSLGNMAAALGLNTQAEQWRRDADTRSALINKYMWDPKTGFYYNVNKKDNSFTYKKKNDLKRQEIIGFLPLWAGVADSSQAAILVKKLTNPDKFWRKYGVPSLSADDPYYDPKGYWNGPVWVQWNYLIEYGLLQYGYKDVARELVNRVASNMINRLKADHTFWEFYSPDDNWGGYHQTYIWAGIINAMLLDLQTSE